MAKATQQIYAEDMSEEKVEFALEVCSDAFNQASFQGKVYSYSAAFIRAAFEKQRRARAGTLEWGARGRDAAGVAAPPR